MLFLDRFAVHQQDERELADIEHIKQEVECLSVHGKYCVE
jgi:hypothetical protein